MSDDNQVLFRVEILILKIGYLYLISLFHIIRQFKIEELMN
jgi:hypothetical protein